MRLMSQQKRLWMMVIFLKLPIVESNAQWAHKVFPVTPCTWVYSIHMSRSNCNKMLHKFQFFYFLFVDARESSCEVGRLLWLCVLFSLIYWGILSYRLQLPENETRPMGTLDHVWNLIRHRYPLGIQFQTLRILRCYKHRHDLNNLQLFPLFLEHSHSLNIAFTGERIRRSYDAKFAELVLYRIPRKFVMELYRTRSLPYLTFAVMKDSTIYHQNYLTSTFPLQKG